MKLLFENWRQYLLTERFSKAEGEAALGPENKKMRRAYTRYLADQERGPWEYDRDDPDYREYEADPAKIKGTAAQLIRWIWDVVPADLAGIEAGNDPKKKAKEVDIRQGLILMWIRKLILKTPDIIDEFIGGNPRGDLWGSFEHFFQHNHLMPQKELLGVKSFEELHQMVVDTKPAVEEFRQSRLKSPKMIAEGTTFLRGDWKYDFMKGGVDEKAYKKFVELSKSEMENLSADEAKAIRRQRQQEALETAGEGGWVIMEIHNKAASCFHGVVGWCTAAPGQGYFEEYYKPDDPLFIFENEKTDEKFQFHYGTKQFMNAEDFEVGDALLKELHNVLMQTAASEKYRDVIDASGIQAKTSEDPEELLALTKRLYKASRDLKSPSYKEYIPSIPELIGNAATPSEALLIMLLGKSMLRPSSPTRGRIIHHDNMTSDILEKYVKGVSLPFEEDVNRRISLDTLQKITHSQAASPDLLRMIAGAKATPGERDNMKVGEPDDYKKKEGGWVDLAMRRGLFEIARNHNTPFDMLLDIISWGKDRRMLTRHYNSFARNALENIVKGALEFGVDSEGNRRRGPRPDARVSIDQLKTALRAAAETFPPWVGMSRGQRRGNTGFFDLFRAYSEGTAGVDLAATAIDYLGIDQDTLNDWAKGGIRDSGGHLRQSDSELYRSKDRKQQSLAERKIRIKMKKRR